ncbi:bifunctional metallophosphatase/5'-nucleotidase [Membranihabitans maritimus]|uniref:bifunctional metallophosphatase/5'-nucleotidase n=1 Tax=Membranihabitans maritimus TaxID=2904244 RepID=UPI001F228911|nr:metallophosphatase [Membranihabitans maritimus]
MTSRRNFIKWSSLGGMFLSSGVFPFDLFSSQSELTKLTILHTNDMHSRIEPFPDDGSRNANMGGIVRRASMVKDIRSKEDNVLLLDSGDIFQGTPYFNFFKGELEFKAMTAMKYDVATIGNHDFDAGIEGFHNQLKHAKFDFVSANYNFDDTILHSAIQPFTVKKVGGIKIGIFGLGIELEGLVPKELYKDTQYIDPVPTAQKTAMHLKFEKDCDLVICLSHLGFKYSSSKIDDLKLAKATSGIDIILGGHTHTFLDEPVLTKNKNGETIIINQVGWAGILLGRIDLYLEKNNTKRCYSCKNIKVL